MRWQASEPGARAAFDEAVEVSRDPEILARAALGAGGRFYMPVTSDPAYVARLEEALAALGDAEGPLRARLLARLAEHLALAGAGDRPAQLGAEAVAMARRVGDDGALAAALMGRHAALLDIEHAPERLATIDEAVAVAERIGAGEVAALALHWRIFDLVELGDLAAAKASHARLEALALELHQPLYTHSALAWRGEWAHVAGRLDEAERIHRESLRVAEAAGSPDARGFFLTQLFAVRRDQGRLGELLDPVERLARQRGAIGVIWRAPLPLVLLQAGERERAREAYEAALPAALNGLPGSLFRLSGLTCVAEACAAVGDAQGAERADRRAGAPRRPPRADRRSAAAGARSGATSACSTRPPAARRRRASSCRALWISTSPSTPRCWPRSRGAISPMYQASASALYRASGNPPPTQPDRPRQGSLPQARAPRRSAGSRPRGG